MFNRKCRFYSQNGEDYLLWHFFKYKRKGFYVDVGAFDGRYLSNTYLFEQQGWNGLCIEPNPVYHRLCQINRPKALSLNVACVADEKLTTVDFFSEKMGIYSSILIGRENEVRSRYEKSGRPFEGFQKIPIKASTLNALLKRHLPLRKKPDCISIDVEGAEIQVLRGLDLSQFEPRVLIIEANSEENRAEIDTYMVTENHYFVARRVDVNVIYVRNQKDIKKIQRIPIRVQLEKMLHPLGEDFTIPAYIQGRNIGNPRTRKRF